VWSMKVFRSVILEQ